MNRNQAETARDKAAVKVAELGARALAGEQLGQEEVRQLLVLRSVHSVAVAQLRSTFDGWKTAQIVVHLDDALGVVKDLARDKAQLELRCANVEASIQTALAYLEGV
jgi:hypothetical protein